jgi:5S rRNA maturation endonuclease (ribonuclease M5)
VIRIELAKVLHYYGLYQDSPEYKIVCPFHEDINASLKINLKDNSFYCFGCNKTGDALKFVQLLNKNLDDLSACMRYYKILKSKRVKVLKQKNYTKIKVEDEQALIEAEDYYNGLKSINWEKYDGPEKLYMRARGFIGSTLNKCKAKVNYNNAYPIVFPMYDLKEFKGWVCRTTNKAIEKQRKYLYNTGFSRSNTLVGDYAAKVVIIVEGYMDWLKMRQFGKNKVAAILGWKATDQQIKKLKTKGVSVIISALDNDKCGIDGTKHLSKHFNIVRFQFPKGKKDPGEMSKAELQLAFEKTKKEFGRLENGFNRRY